MFPGFDKRFTTEMKQVAPTGMASSVRIHTLPERSNTIWVGGSILAGMSTFDDKWITADEYDEYGAGIVHERCPIFF